jgi:hypothetical protein
VVALREREIDGAAEIGLVEIKVVKGDIRRWGIVIHKLHRHRRRRLEE